MATPEETQAAEAAAAAAAAAAEKAGTSGQEGAGGEKSQAPPTWETFLEAQTPEVKALAETHTQGLKSALDSERGTRKDLEKQVRDLAGKAEKGSEAEKQLTQIADTVAAAERKADFMEAAHAAGVTNLKLGYTVAVQDEMFDRQGRPNFEAMKATYPELFGGGKPATPPGHAGAGTGTVPPPAADMNAFIRGSAR